MGEWNGLLANIDHKVIKRLNKQDKNKNFPIPGKPWNVEGLEVKVHYS